MQKYDKTGFGIIIDIYFEDYLIKANILKRKSRDTDEYEVSFELGEKEVGWWMELDGNTFTLHSNNINLDVCELVSAKLEEGYFNPFMERYKYDMWCRYEGDRMFRGVAEDEI